MAIKNNSKIMESKTIFIIGSFIFIIKLYFSIYTKYAYAAFKPCSRFISDWV